MTCANRASTARTATTRERTQERRILICTTVNRARFARACSRSASRRRPPCSRARKPAPRRARAVPAKARRQRRARPGGPPPVRPPGWGRVRRRTYLPVFRPAARPARVRREPPEPLEFPGRPARRRRERQVPVSHRRARRALQAERRGRLLERIAAQPRAPAWLLPTRAELRLEHMISRPTAAMVRTGDGLACSDCSGCSVFVVVRRTASTARQGSTRHLRSPRGRSVRQRMRPVRRTA
jgi:hypothetical protein